MGTANKSHATSFKKPPWRDKTTYMQVNASHPKALYSLRGYGCNTFQ